MTTVKQQHVPDILDCLAQLSNDEVPTPPKLAEPCSTCCPPKSGRTRLPLARPVLQVRDVPARDRRRGCWTAWPRGSRTSTKRREHIFRNMLYGTSITEMTGMISRRTLYCSRDASGEHSVVRFDSEHGKLAIRPAPTTTSTRTATLRCVRRPRRPRARRGRENYAYSFIHGAYPTKEMKDMKFDVIVGNPPYQVGTEGYGATASTDLPPLRRAGDRRWTPVRPDDHPVPLVRRRQGSRRVPRPDDRRPATARHRRQPEAVRLLPRRRRSGAASTTSCGTATTTATASSPRGSTADRLDDTRDLRDGDGVLVRDNRAIEHRRQGRATSDPSSVEDVCTVTKPFGLTMRSNYPGSVPEPSTARSRSSTRIASATAGPTRSQRNHEWIDRWKVLLPMAGETATDERRSSYVLGEPIALAPGSACTQTYFIAGMFDTARRDRELRPLPGDKFVRFLVLQRKTTQHVTPDRFRFVPMLDMTRRWTDGTSTTHFGLTERRDRLHRGDHQAARTRTCRSTRRSPSSHLPGGVKYRPRRRQRDDEDDR